MSPPIGSRGVSRVPFFRFLSALAFVPSFAWAHGKSLPLPHRRASWQNACLAEVAAHANAGVSSALLACGAGLVNLTPNPAVNRTPICVTSSARGGAGAGYLIR